MQSAATLVCSVLLGALLALGEVSTANPADPDLCVVSSPLETPYFTPWLDTPRKVRGCSAPYSPGNPQAATQEVHAVSVHGAPGPTVRLWLHLGLDGTSNATAALLSRLVLILVSEPPVNWKISVEEGVGGEQLQRIQVHLVSVNSYVEADLPLNVVVVGKLRGRKALARYVRKLGGFLASYGEVNGANRLDLNVGQQTEGASVGVQCDPHIRGSNPSLQGALSTQLHTEGCFHEDYIGDHPVDVYVLELDSGGPVTTPHRVLVQLQGEGAHNVTLVLKSHQPIVWQLGPSSIQGNLLIVSDREDRVSNSGQDNLQVRSKPLPDGLVSLLLNVTAEFGPPILYARTGLASSVTLVVGSRNKAGLRSGPEGGKTDLEDGSQELMQQQPHFAGSALITAQEPQSNPVAQLKAAMRVVCGKSRFNVSFPLGLVRQLGSPLLSLNDVTCDAHSNHTHVTLSSHTTSCGSTSENDGKLVSFSNNVLVRFATGDNDDEDLEASGDSLDWGRIPVMCHYQPLLPHISGFPEAVDVPGGTSGGSSTHSSLYHLELFRDRLHQQPVDFLNPDPVIREVQYDETLYVRAWIDGVVPLQVVTENCWVSNSSDTHQRSRVVLLRNTCPMDLSAQLQGSQHGSFSFQVNRHEYEMMGAFHLHCRLGVCTTNPKHTKGNLVRCVDPEQYCSRLRPYLDKAVSSAQQLVSVGPLRPVPRRTKTSCPPVVVCPELSSEEQTKVVHVGVSTEVAVGIALASFAIGVGLTAALWCIHMKTDPLRRQGDKPLPGTVGGCSLSPHSGCSSTNSQAAMTS